MFLPIFKKYFYNDLVLNKKFIKWIISIYSMSNILFNKKQNKKNFQYLKSVLHFK